MTKAKQARSKADDECAKARRTQKLSQAQSLIDKQDLAEEPKSKRKRAQTLVDDKMISKLIRDNFKIGGQISQTFRSAQV